MSKTNYTYQGTLTAQASDWAFVGRDEWSEDTEGVIHNPTWRFYTGGAVEVYFPHETDDRQREDYVFLRPAGLSSLELSVEVMLFCQTTYGQIVFRAQDSRRFYALVIRDVYEKDIYEVSLWVQNEHGYRRRIGQALAGCTHLRTPASQRPKWDQISLTAEGPRLMIRLNGQIVIEVNDPTYAAGVVGLGALGRIAFRDLRVAGSRADPDSPWTSVPGQAPPYVYAYKSDRKNLTRPTRPRMSCPSGVVLDDGEILLLRTIGYETKDDAPGTVFARSVDNGVSWEDEWRIAGPRLYWPFQLSDGRLSALTSVFCDEAGRAVREIDYKAVDEGKIKIRHEVSLVFSQDRGRTWGAAEPMKVAGRPLSEYGSFWIYSGFRRLSDGAILWTPYGGKSEHTVAEQRTNQTFCLRSEDDGRSWSEPLPVETSHLDTNEGAAAELANGDVLIFMRSVRSAYMWKARSEDKGRSWLPLEKTTITLDCPQFLRHSSGLLVLQSRMGMVLVSADDGQSWGSVWNIGHCVHMGCLLETADGALLVAHLDAGFADITKVRAMRMRVSSEGLLPG